jgi:hypothetical protein
MEWVVSKDSHGLSCLLSAGLVSGAAMINKIFSPVEFWCAVASRFACFVGNTEYYGARGGAFG